MQDLYESAQSMRSLRVSMFDLHDTLECGQTFCWRPEEHGYINTDVGQAVYVEQRGDRLHYITSESDVSLKRMFRLDDPLTEIQREISKDDFMRECIAFAPGLRIVSDPFYPCLVSFLCSIRNNIPNIYRTTQRLREKYGPTYELDGRTYHGMPDIESVLRIPPAELRALGLGWRADFILKTSRALQESGTDAQALRALGYEGAHRALKMFHGVGDKVADCVCLFSLGFLEAFPIDVWIERVVQEHYALFTGRGRGYAAKTRMAREYFGRYAGYAQEYLYYYTRSRARSR